MNIEYARLGSDGDPRYVMGQEKETKVDLTVGYIDHGATRIPDWLVSQYSSSVEILDLSWNRISTLSGVESLVRLRELILDSNDISVVRVFADCYSSTLRTLSLNKNRFENLQELVSSVKDAFPKVKFLSLLGNPCVPDQLTRPDIDDQDDYTRYRLFVVSQLSYLEFLDSTPVSAKERSKARQIGRYQLVAKPRIGNYRPDANDELPRGFSPLPTGEVDDRPSKSAFGTLKYRYTGRHSEGNRFIRDTQL